MGPKLSAGFTTVERNTFLGDADVNENHTVYGFNGHEHEEFGKFKTIETIHIEAHHSEFTWQRR